MAEEQAPKEQNIGQPLSQKEKFRIKTEISKCLNELYTFFSQKKGCIVCISDDLPFSTMLRQAIKGSGISRPDLINCSQTYEQLDNLMKKVLEAELRPVVLIERYLRAEGVGHHIIRDFKSKWENVPFFVMMTDEDKDLRNLVMESDCLGIITKPIDANAMLIILAGAVRDPTPIQALLTKADDLLKNQMPVDSLKITKAVAKAKPDNIDSYVMMGDALRQMDHNDKAKEVYNIAIQKAPENLKPLKKMAEIAKEEGNIKEELRYLLTMDKISPLNSERKTQIAETILNAGNVSAASEFLDRATRCMDKGMREKIRSLSLEIAIANNDNPSVAEKYLRRCIDMKDGKFTEEDAQIFNLLGLALRKQGKNSDAIREYKKALKILPDSPELLYNFALALSENYGVQEACKCFVKILQAFPGFVKKSADIAYNMGHVFFMGQQHSAAKKCMELCLSIDPEKQEAKKELAKLQQLTDNSGGK